jgi:hypothetical protein
MTALRRASLAQREIAWKSKRGQFGVHRLGKRR